MMGRGIGRFLLDLAWLTCAVLIMAPLSWWQVLGVGMLLAWGLIARRR